MGCVDAIKAMAGGYTEERKQFACLIAYELGAMKETDSLQAMSKCLEYAQKHEFVLDKDAGEGFIDTEVARLEAADYARKIAEELRGK